ncbi:MAG: hypothetical protein HOP08_01605 [Cyclobacteriaceae bacterium]|nr:hypothetical protein [Cyclobacteriaceae bacterium]
MTPQSLYQITWWISLGILPVFFIMEIYWFVRMHRRMSDIPKLLRGFFLYNLPVILLIISMMFQSIPGLTFSWIRLSTLLIIVISDLYLHWIDDKSGEITGLLHAYLLLGFVPLLIIQEICVRFIG